MERHARLVILRERNINRRTRVLAKSAVLTIANDADYFGPRTIGASKAHPFAERTLVCEVATRKRRIDDHCRRGLVAIMSAEVAALKHRNSHRREVVQSDYVLVHNKCVIRKPGALAAVDGIGSFLTLNDEAGGAPSAAHRNDARKAGGFDARKRFDSLDDLGVELLPLGLCITQQIDVELRIEDFVRGKPGIDRLRIV